jgi:spectinomycin phosphotransferase
MRHWMAVDTPPPETFGDQDLLAAMAAHWNLRADGVRYVPKGTGSYHWVADVGGRPAYFVTVDDLDTKPWIADQREMTFAGLTVAYETARTLEHDLGLSQVVGPIESPEGSVIGRLTDQHSVAVFPFVEGTAGQWGDQLDDHRRTELLRELAQLHQATPALHVPMGRRSLGLPERHVLNAALNSLGRPWQGGPLAEPARRALATHAAGVASRLEQLDDLAGRLRREQEDGSVVTHGEPHPGNLISTDQGLRLIDWDTAAWALAERDLWMLDDGSTDAFAPYQEITGTRVSHTAVSYYRLAWSLSDIASFLAMFRSPHRPTQWLNQKWDGFVRLLAGAPSTPYG